MLLLLNFVVERWGPCTRTRRNQIRNRHIAAGNETYRLQLRINFETEKTELTKFSIGLVTNHHQ
jgi:hypothetical protein